MREIFEGSVPKRKVKYKMKLISVCSLNKRDIVTTEMYLHELYIHRVMKLHSYFCYGLEERVQLKRERFLK